jgi:hypothetical protein
MRAFVMKAVLALGTGVGLLGVGPSSAEAHWFRYRTYYYPAYYYAPAYYYPPAPVYYYPTYYYATPAPVYYRAYYGPRVSVTVGTPAYYYTPTYYYPAATTYYYSPGVTFYYGY